MRSLAARARRAWTGTSRSPGPSYWLWGLDNGLAADPERCRRIAAAFAPAAAAAFAPAPAAAD